MDIKPSKYDILKSGDLEQYHDFISDIYYYKTGKNLANAVKFQSVNYVPPVIKRIKYDIMDTPEFIEGEVIEVDLGYYGIQKVPGEQYIVEAVVVGKFQSDQNFVLWLVDFGEYYFKPTYPYKIMAVPVQSIIKTDLLNWD